MAIGDSDMVDDSFPATPAVPAQPNVLDAPLDSPAVRRLIEEVRAEEMDVPRSYNRTFNRHNR